MKKVIFIIALTALLLSGVIFWILKTEEPVNLANMPQFGVIFILILFALILAFSRLKSLKQGLPAEDEFSKKLLNIAAGRAYYFSLYLWLGLMYLDSDGKYETESLFGIGIVGMAVLLGIHWVILKYTGIKDE